MKLITLENLKSFWKDVKSYVDNGLSKKADSVHGTHVTYGTINGKAPGTASAGTSSKVAREDHVHPVQTTVSGNAGTATKLQTARTITLKGRANGSASFDGSGNIIIDTNPKMFESGGTSGKSGYVAVAQLKITGSYANRPTEFKLVGRGRGTACTVSVAFANVDSTDPALSSIRYWGTDYGVFIHKSATSTWLLYATKSEEYDSIAVVDCCYGSQSITITYPGSFITEKPTSNITNASLGGSFGQANTANSATKATQDSAGQQINTTYIKGLSVSGKTITYTKGDGSTGTITTQDTNTTYSTGTASALGLTKLYTGTGTATDGTMTQAAIKTSLDGKANSSHTHNSLLATDLSSLTVSLNNYNLSSGTPKVAYYFCPNDGSGSNITGRPNDSDKKAFNLVVESLRFVNNTDYMTKQTYTQGSQKIIYVRYCTNGTWTAWEKVYTSTQKPTASEIGASATGHTHNYAGSSSAGGAANSATKLATARTINGTSFNGSANITTANWGTARTLTIGSASKSVNGSGNVSWSLSEIGAAPAGYGLGTTCTDKSGQNCNDILVTGFYRGSNMTNKPSGCTQGWIYLLVMSHDNSSWVRQVAYDFGTASQVYTRVKQNGSWTAWVATDTNTWRGVQDNLTSTATDQSLSANQGKVLKGLIDGKAASNHTHSYVPLANGGNITIHADSDSSSTGEYALIKAGHNELKIASSAGGTTVTKGQDKLTFNGNIVYHAGRKPTISEIGAAAASHTHNYAGSSSAGGNANAAVKLATARTINGTNFDGSANITTANWGTARNLNGVSVNGSTNYTIPVENYYCNVNDNNTNLYHRILTTDIATASWADKSLIIVMHSGYQGGGFGIAKITFRTNDISSAANSQGEIKWLVRNGFAANALVFNFVNQAKNACMDVFYKSPGTYAGMTWYVLSEGGRGGAHSKQWTKYNTNASGTNAYTEANMKTLRTYTSTLVSATDAGHVSTANSANTLATARTINGTSFNGSANITTANWGTARNIQIGNTAKSVNGSANVTWSLSEIGAAPASHTHNYVPTSDVAATATANKVAKLDGSADINVRLLKSNYANQSTISGALAYRVNNGSDNYLRFCSDTAAIRTWLGVAASSHTHNYAGSSSAGGAANSATKLATARTIKVGNTGKSFDGSGGITFTLAEMGIVSGTSAPSNSDGRADGTVYFRYA